MPQYAPVIDLSALNGTNGFRLDGIDADDHAGLSVATAGDINGDGFADLIIGAPRRNTGGDSNAGETYVVFGRASGWSAAIDLSTLDGTNGFRLLGLDPDDLSGFSVASAGDVNGDGFSDFIIGAYQSDPSGDSNAGETYVVFGRAGGWTATLDLSTLNGANGFRLDGIDAGDQSGYSVASAGDVNGDGFADVIVGAPGGDPGGDGGAGESYVVFGAASGWTAAFDLSALNGANGFRLDGVNASDRSGYSVASAGDVNGDGFADIVIGADFAAAGGDTFAGQTYVVFGQANGWSASLDLSTLNGANGFSLQGIDQFDQSGFSVASAGDINGDGFSDLIVGAPAGDANAGESYVVFGRASGWTAALDLSTLNGANGFRLDGIDPNDASGVSVAGAGDVNGDGFSDLIIGANQSDPGGDSGAGESYVVFGRASGWSAALDLSTLNGDTGFRLDGIDVNDQSGYSVAGAGDVNGDGFADIVIGAWLGDPGDNNAGESYVVFGSAPGEAVTRTGTDIANIIRGGAFNDTLNGLGGNDTLFGGAGIDTLNGGTGIDTAGIGFGYQNASFSRTVSGSWIVSSGIEASDTLNGMEYVRFTDRTLALRPAEGSIDGNGTSDILLRNASTGQVQLWTQSGATTSSTAVIGGSDTSFAAIGQGDFNGDGRFDVLFRNASGTLAQWQLDGATIAGTRAYSSDPSWAIVGIGDFNGDFRDDILYRNADGVLAQWRMDGLNVASVAAFAVSDNSWGVAAVADFNGDGRDDILWRNSSGVLAQWSLDGFSATSLGAFATSDPAWQIVGTGDFNGDLREDILWRNSGGITAVWLMDGTTAFGVNTLSIDPDPAWSVSDVGDYNGDGRDDILWQQADGTFTLWTLNGFQATNAGNIGNPGAGWTDIG